MPTPPQTYSNPKGDNAWDNDAVQWMVLEHPDVAEAFDRGALMECARRQAHRLESDLDRVLLAARLCERYGVEQVEVFDPKIGKKVWRLRRTDSGAPEYPDYHADTSFRMDVSPEHRTAAGLLHELLGDYEKELLASGKAKNTVFTYVDRTQRFLNRVLGG